MEDENNSLRAELKEKAKRERPGFMDWLEKEVDKINDQKIKREQALNILFNARADLMKKSGLENLEKTALEFIEHFEQLTGVQQRDFIERMIAKIVIKKDNALELHVLWDPKKGVTRMTKSSISDQSGGGSLRYSNIFSFSS